MTGHAVVAQDVGLSIDGVSILRDISLEIGEGEIVGLIGPNGAGKTSFINVLTGITPPTSGNVEMFGKDVSAWKPHRRAQLGMGRTFQTSNLFSGMSVVDNVRLAVQGRNPSLLTGFQMLRSDGKTEAKVDESIRRVGLTSKAGYLASDLSHGDQRKLELAMVVATGTRLVLLDEPMAGVNVEDINGLIDLISEIHRETGAAVLIVEHHLDVVLSLSHRIAVFHHGELLAIDKPEVVMANTTVQTAYIGDAL